MKQSGLGDQLYIDGYDLSGDVGSIDDIGGGPDELMVTGIDKSAKERIGGQRDGRVSMMTYFNPGSNQEHARLKGLPTTDVQIAYCRGSAIGNQGASMVAKQTNYDLTRGDDGALSFKVDALANTYGLEWGEQLTAGKSTLGVAGALTSVDYGAGIATTNFGLQAYLQVFAFTGTSATVAVQSSTDNAVGDAFANVTGAAFTAATAIGVQRIATANNAAVERYLRVNVTGTFSNLVFNVIVCRNLTLTAF